MLDRVIEFRSEIIDHFISRGFSVNERKEKVKFLQGLNHDLEKKCLKANIHMDFEGINVTFFQDVIKKDDRSGYYDLNRYSKMPENIRRMFIVEASRLVESIFSKYDFSYDSDHDHVNRFRHYFLIIRDCVVGYNKCEYPLYAFNDLWSESRFVRDETGWPAESEYSSKYTVDRDGKNVRCGEIRYFKRNGRTFRGTAYTNMNSMFRIVYGPDRDDYAVMTCGELFTPKNGETLRRNFSKEEKEKIYKVKMKKAVDEMDFEKAIVFRDLLNKKGAEIYFT